MQFNQTYCVSLSKLRTVLEKDLSQNGCPVEGSRLRFSLLLFSTVAYCHSSDGTRSACSGPRRTGSGF